MERPVAMLNSDSAELVRQAEEAFDEGDLARAEEFCSTALVAQPSCVPAHQLLARLALAVDDRSRCLELLERRSELPVDAHFTRWGMIAEEADELDLAGEIYGLLLQQGRRDPIALYRLGMLHLEKGERGRAIELLADATREKPDFTQALVELAQCYVEDEWWGLAAHAYRQALDAEPGHAEAQAGLQLVEERMRELSAPAEAATPSEGKTAARLLALFAGREGVHARQWVDAAGKNGYSPVQEPLNEHLLRLHLQGDVTLGTYPVRSDDTVLFGAIDLDVSRAALRRCQEQPDFLKPLMELVRADALRLEQLCEHLQLPVYAEDSGYKGMHLWLFFSEPIPAEQVRRFLEALVQRAGPASPELHWEIFPKQDRVEEGKLGNLIKIPLGVHRKTGRRCLFTDRTGQAYADQGAVLERIERIGREQFAGAVDRLAGAEGSGTEAVKPGEPAQDGFPEFGALFEGCPVIRALEEKARVTHHLTHEERLVLKCVLAHTGDRGRELIHGIVGQCLDYEFRVTQQQIERTPRNPISCPKIRRRLPEVTASVNCACSFELPEGGYPSPLLHLDEAYTRGKGQTAGRNGELVERYVQLRRDLQRLRQDLAQVEDDLHYALQMRGTDRMKAAGWVLRRDEQGRLLVEVEVD